ncbi:hypothetical protein [Halostagnicola sp. A-GB9-2]|uniref:hypothetical protein n=1 Tax=Halostagnicola sp. A-GB9-2 TaxID=3048066 RepID=UPI0024C035F2|nr:hypothetical protein [Halostagnicola sp. A-GB9-2]MDJ1432153.1 hypothetical protein [Halostagnicola sp. A-GB9-2]
MSKITPIVLAVALVVSLAVLPLGAAGALADDSDQSAQDAQEPNESIAPGERLNGVIGVQEAEVDAEVSDRAYGIKIASAQTNETKAAVVGEQLADVDERLASLEERQESLEAEREAGNISEGEYRAAIATIEAETRTADRLANSTATNASEIPADTLEERGINTSAIQELSDRANELSGPETAEIARSIAGNSVGHSVVSDRAPGGPVDAPNEGVDGNETPDAAGNPAGLERENGTNDTAFAGPGNGAAEETPGEQAEDSDADTVGAEDADGNESTDGGSDGGSSSEDNSGSDVSTSDDSSDTHPSDSGSGNARPTLA